MTAEFIRAAPLTELLARVADALMPEVDDLPLAPLAAAARHQPRAVDSLDRLVFIWAVFLLVPLPPAQMTFADVVMIFFQLRHALA